MPHTGGAMTKIAVLDSIPLNPGDVSWTPVEAFGELIIYDATSTQQMAEHAAGADIVLTNKAVISSRDIPALKQCKMIGVLATGTNVVDLKAMAEAGITVCNVPDYGPEDVAQHALALLLELARGTALHSRGVKAGEWHRNGWCYWHKAPLSLTGLTLGVIGFGHIGQIMGRYGHALGMRVLAYSRHRRGRTAYPFTWAGLPELLQKSDVISLHCPLTPETGGLINAKSIASMKKGVIIINTARGGLVDEQAAAQALACGQLGALGTDVLSVEPPAADNPLLTAPNTLITPHMAWATVNARQNIIDIMADNISAFLQGSPINRVN